MRSTRNSIPVRCHKEIYVWQRVWNGQVEAALFKASKIAAGFAVLTAEIDLRDGAPKIFQGNLDYMALKASVRSMSMMTRIQ